MNVDWAFLKAELEEIAEHLEDLRARFESLKNDIDCAIDEIDAMPEVKGDGREA